MLVLQQDIRVQVNHDLDCSASSQKLMAMRTQMSHLIARRNALGGPQTSVDAAARLQPAYRPELRRRAL